MRRGWAGSASAKPLPWAARSGQQRCLHRSPPAGLAAALRLHATLRSRPRLEPLALAHFWVLEPLARAGDVGQRLHQARAAALIVQRTYFVQLDAQAALGAGSCRGRSGRAAGWLSGATGSSSTPPPPSAAHRQAPTPPTRSPWPPPRTGLLQLLRVLDGRVVPAPPRVVGHDLDGVGRAGWDVWGWPFLLLPAVSDEHLCGAQGGGGTALSVRARW